MKLKVLLDRNRETGSAPKRVKEETRMTAKPGPVQNQADQLPLWLIPRIQILQTLGGGAVRWRSDDSATSEPQRPDASATFLKEAWRSYPVTSSTESTIDGSRSLLSPSDHKNNTASSFSPLILVPEKGTTTQNSLMFTSGDCHKGQEQTAWPGTQTGRPPDPRQVPKC